MHDRMILKVLWVSAILNHFFIFLHLKAFNSKLFCNFADVICPYWPWSSSSRAEPLGGALHIRRRYWRFVFGLRNFHNRMLNKNIADVAPRGVVYTLRSVSWRSCTFWHTLRCIVYSYVGVYSVCFSAWLWKASKTSRQMLSTTFFICSNQES